MRVDCVEELLWGFDEETLVLFCSVEEELLLFLEEFGAELSFGLLSLDELSDISDIIEDSLTLEDVLISSKRPSSFPVANSITKTTAITAAADIIKYLYLLFLDINITPLSIYRSIVVLKTLLLYHIRKALSRVCGWQAGTAIFSGAETLF